MYTFPFEPHPTWSSFFAEAPEIKAYIEKATKKWNLDKNVQFHTKMVESHWNDETGKWKVTLERDGKTFEDEAEILVDATGFLK